MAASRTRCVVPLLVWWAIVGRYRGNGCPVQLPHSYPAGRAGFGSPLPWLVAVPGTHLSVIVRGLVGSSHDAILWSRACHTFPSPCLMALGASTDHRGGCLVSGDVLIRPAPVLISPHAGVGGVDRIQVNAMSAGLCGHRLRNTAVGMPATILRKRLPRTPWPIQSRPTARASAKSRSSTATAAMW